MTIQEATTAKPTLADAHQAVRRFLGEVLPDAQRVRITRLAPRDDAAVAWEAEALVWQPNATIAALGLATLRPVLDQSLYLLRLDAHLNVVSYESQEAEGTL